MLTTGGVQLRWLDWGTEHREWNPSEKERAEFIQLWLAVPPADPTFSERQCHHAAEARSGRSLQVAQSECRPSDDDDSLATIRATTRDSQHWSSGRIDPRDVNASAFGKHQPNCAVIGLG